MSTEQLGRVRSILARMLSADFPEAEFYRAQLSVASLHPHETGCRIVVDRERAAPATRDVAARPSQRLPVEAFGHGKSWILLHANEGYLDDLELLHAAVFPDAETLKIRTDS